MQAGFPPIRTRPVGGADDPAGDQQRRDEEYPRERLLASGGAGQLTRCACIRGLPMRGRAFAFAQRQTRCQPPPPASYSEPRYFGADAGGRPTAGGQGSPRLYESTKVGGAASQRPPGGLRVEQAHRCAACHASPRLCCVRGGGSKPPQDRKPPGDGFARGPCPAESACGSPRLSPPAAARQLPSPLLPDPPRPRRPARTRSTAAAAACLPRALPRCRRRCTSRP
jgi:hypothetical protein